MNKAEKINAILEVVNRGIPKRTLEPQLNGRTIRQMLRGERVTERKVEEIYANLQTCQERMEAAKRKSSGYQEMYPEVGKEVKIKAVLEAVASGKCAKYGLDPGGTGNAIRDLQRGISVGIGKLNEMYDNLLKMSCKADKRRKKRATMASAQVSSIKQPTGSDKEPSSRLSGKLREQEKQVAFLVDKVATLEAKIGELTMRLEQANLPLKIAGITVVQKSDRIGGRAYLRWYGQCRHQGKQRWIYIGKDKNRATEKITQWISKNEWNGQ